MEALCEKACGIDEAAAYAVPFPDGNSRVTLNVKLGSFYEIDDDLDGKPHPFVLIGGQVHGTQEAPFTQASCTTPPFKSSATLCTYDLVAPTTLLRNAQTFLARDLAWDNFSGTGKIAFAPSFGNLAVSSTTPTADPEGDPAVKSPMKKDTFYTVSGYDLTKIKQGCKAIMAPEDPSYLRAKVLIGKRDLASDGFRVETDNLATIFVTPTDATLTNIRLHLETPSKYNGQEKDSNARPIVEWDLAIPKVEESKSTASPAFLRVGDSQTSHSVALIGQNA